MCSVPDVGRVWAGREFPSAVLVRAVYFINNRRALPSAKNDSDSDLPCQSCWGLCMVQTCGKNPAPFPVNGVFRQHLFLQPINTDQTPPISEDMVRVVSFPVFYIE